MGSAGFTTVRDGYILGRNIVDPFCIPIQGLKFEGGLPLKVFESEHPTRRNWQALFPQSPIQAMMQN